MDATPLPPLTRRARSLALPQLSSSVLGGAFVLLWSTGYIAGKVGLLHAGAFSLLEARFVGAAVLFGLIALAGRAVWPDWRALGHSAVVGLLTLALQFSGVYFGIQRGAEIGVAALMVGAMPLATALLAPWFGERLQPRQWLGLALGFAGVVLVLSDRIGFGHGDALAYLALGVSLLGISTGTLYQKRHASAIDLRVGLFVQHAVAALALLPLALGEGLRFDASPALAWSLAWIILGNSLLTFALLFVLLKRGAANTVAQLFFLIPPVTAVFGFVLFGETLTLAKLSGFALAAVGVFVGTRAAARA